VRQYLSINPKDISVIGFYKDGSSKPVNISKSDIVFDNTMSGPQTVVVRTSVGTASFETRVMEFTGITVTSQLKISKVGGPYPRWENVLDIQGVWDQMGTQKINVTDCQVSQFNPGVAGTQTITVTYRGKQASFNVNVVAIESIRIASNPTQTTYYQGEPLVLTGLKVMGQWPGLPEEEVPIIANNISGYNAANKGRQNVTVTYGGKTATFTVEVLDIMGILNGTWVDTGDYYNISNEVIGKRTWTYTFNNGSVTYTYRVDYTGGEKAGTSEQYRITGTYTIDTAPGKSNSSVMTPAVWHGKVTFTRTGGDTQINFPAFWETFTIATNPRIFLVGEVKGTVVWYLYQNVPPPGGSSSTYSGYLVKQ